MHSFEHTASETIMRRFREETVREILEFLLSHQSGCASYNKPAYPNTGCDCGLLLSEKELHEIIHFNYGADPLTCAEGVAEEVGIRQLGKIILRGQMLSEEVKQ